MHRGESIRVIRESEVDARVHQGGFSVMSWKVDQLRKVGECGLAIVTSIVRERTTLAIEAAKPRVVVSIEIT